MCGKGRRQTTSDGARWLLWLPTLLYVIVQRGVIGSRDLGPGFSYWNNKNDQDSIYTYNLFLILLFLILIQPYPPWT